MAVDMICKPTVLGVADLWRMPDFQYLSAADARRVLSQYGEHGHCLIQWTGKLRPPGQFTLFVKICDGANYCAEWRLDSCEADRTQGQPYSLNGRSFPSLGKLAEFITNNSPRITFSHPVKGKDDIKIRLRTFCFPGPDIVSAAVKGEVALLGQLLDQGESSWQLGVRRDSAAIRAAVVNGHIDVMQLLLQHAKSSCSLLQKDEFGLSLLHHAIIVNSPKAVNALINHGHPFNPRIWSTDIDGKTRILTPHQLGKLCGQDCEIAVKGLEILWLKQSQVIIANSHLGYGEWLHWGVHMKSGFETVQAAANGRDGCFLIHPSMQTNKIGEFVLWLSHSNNVRCYHIQQEAEKLYYIELGPLFRDLNELVDYYRTFADNLACCLREPVPPPSPQRFAALSGFSSYTDILDLFEEDVLHDPDNFVLSNSSHATLCNESTLLVEVDEDGMQPMPIYGKDISFASGQQQPVAAYEQPDGATLVPTEQGPDSGDLTFQSPLRNTASKISRNSSDAQLPRFTSPLETLTCSQCQQSSTPNNMAKSSRGSNVYVEEPSELTISMMAGANALENSMVCNKIRSFVRQQAVSAYTYEERADDAPAVPEQSADCYAVPAKASQPSRQSSSGTISTDGSNTQLISPPAPLKTLDGDKFNGEMVAVANQFIDAADFNKLFELEVGCKSKRLSFKDRNVIGCGVFGNVYRGDLRVPTQRFRQKFKKEEVAVKKLVAEDNLASNMKRCERFLQGSSAMMYRHPNVVALLGVQFFTLDRSSPFLMIHELCMHSLDNFLQHRSDRRNIPIEQLCLWASQIADGMKYLSNRGFIHRRLALRNILLTKRSLVAKVSDFSLLSKVKEGSTILDDGTSNPEELMRWYAPESMTFNLFTCKSDVWSYGVTLWELFEYGKRPFPDITDVADLYVYLISGKRPKLQHTCPQSLYADIMLPCWRLQAASRPDFTVISSFFLREPMNMVLSKLSQLVNEGIAIMSAW